MSRFSKRLRDRRADVPHLTGIQRRAFQADVSHHLTQRTGEPPLEQDWNYSLPAIGTFSALLFRSGGVAERWYHRDYATAVLPMVGEAGTEVVIPFLEVDEALEGDFARTSSPPNQRADKSQLRP